MGRLTLVFGVLLALGATHGRAQEIPSPADVLGYGPGARFTDTQGVFRYARHLSEASPRVQLVRYGETPEGRPLILLVLAREDRMDVLDQIRARIDELRDPGLSDFRAAEIARETPAVAWLAYGVHGDEASSTEAALWTAYDIAGAASEAAGILDSLVVLIDPMLNPDGRDRYVQWYRGAKADPPNRYADAYEHAPPWPGGRYNHYLFDLNRDWAWAVQPETRARLAQYARWNPQVLVDFHEMSYTSSYFFFPPAEPVNPVYPPSTSEWGEYFGQANAHEFDRRRWLYYTEQTFDLFYPGYGDSWSSLTGAIGMTYEQAGSRRAGLAVRRPDGTVLTLADRLAHHRIAGLATLRAAAARKTELLENYAAFHRDDGGEGDFLLVPADNPEAVDDLVALLLNQGIVVERGSRSFGATASPYFGYAERTEFPAGTYRVQRRQPRSRLARTLLQAETPFDGTGVEYTYDITAWSLPYAFGVEAHTATGLDASVFEPVTSGLLSEVAVGPLQPVYGYLVPPGFAAAGPLHSYAAVGGRAYALEEGFEAEGRRWPPGTVFLPSIPFDPRPTDRLTARQLARYDVVVAPPARSSVYEQSRDLLAEWVKSGGTLVAMGEAARWTAGAIADLAVRQEDTTSVSDAERLRRALRTREERRSERWEDAVTGVILPARADPEHPLAWGTAAGTPDGPYFVLHRTDLSFEPDDRSEAVIHFPLDVSEVSGVIGERKLDKVAGSSWLATRAIGEGRVVLFADDPLFRLFWRSAFVPFTNSLLYGPSLR
jgi:hypothetical protein